MLPADFEGTYEWSAALAPQLVGWFEELRAGLRAAGLRSATLSLPQGMYKPTFTAFRPHIQRLLATVDSIFIMAYDNGNYVSKAPAVGPNSPLTGGQKIGGWEGNIKYVVNDSLSIGVPAGQVIPTPSHFLDRILPIFPPFFPIFCAFSPSRRTGSNEPQAGTQGQETARG